MTTIRIRDADHARAVLRAARQSGEPMTLVSPAATPNFAGIGWWRQLVRLMRQEFADIGFIAVLDCGPSPGMALAAIRAGVECLRVDVDAAMLEKISGIAEQAGTRVECGGGETLEDLPGEPDPGGRTREKPGKDPEGTEAGGVVRGERPFPLRGE